MANATKRTVGRFTLDTAASTIEGPAEYMKERGFALLSAILDGKDSMFKASAHFSPDVETAILVRLQTDFAGCLGMRSFAVGVRS